MKLLSTTGAPVALGTICLAEFKNPDGSLTVFFKNEKDIGLLIDRLKKDGCTDSELLTSNFWLNETCDRTGGRHCSDGVCGGGSCTATSSGNATYCRCL